MLRTLELRLVEGRNLIAADIGGKSDPYVKFYLNGQNQKSKVIKKTLFPTWNETFNFQVSNGETDILDITVYDHDMIGSDQCIGTAKLPLGSLQENRPTDMWLKLVGVKSGEIRLVLTAKGFGQRTQGVPQTGYAPSPQYQQPPQQQYSAPPPQYQQPPQQQYAPPPQQYAPQPQYQQQQPQPQYAPPPQQQYAPPPQQYAPPPQQYAPQPQYHPPQPTYAPPQPTYMPPQPQYQPNLFNAGNALGNMIMGANNMMMNSMMGMGMGMGMGANPYYQPPTITYAYTSPYSRYSSFILPLGCPPHVAQKMMYGSQLFRAADRDCSGYLNKKEFKRALSSIGFMNVPKATRKVLFRMVDKDGSGRISEREFCEFYAHSTF